MEVSNPAQQPQVQMIVKPPFYTNKRFLFLICSLIIVIALASLAVLRKDLLQKYLPFLSPSQTTSLEERNEKIIAKVGEELIYQEDL
ncbi:MAG: hypothetical protein C4584_01455, partial [Armatimonadetes bacterium]